MCFIQPTSGGFTFEMFILQLTFNQKDTSRFNQCYQLSQHLNFISTDENLQNDKKVVFLPKLRFVHPNGFFVSFLTKVGNTGFNSQFFLLKWSISLFQIDLIRIVTKSEL